MMWLSTPSEEPDEEDLPTEEEVFGTDDDEDEDEDPNISIDESEEEEEEGGV